MGDGEGSMGWVQMAGGTEIAFVRGLLVMCLQ